MFYRIGPRSNLVARKATIDIFCDTATIHLGATTFSIMTFGIMTLSLMAFSIMKFSKKNLIVTLGLNDIQHNDI